MKFFFFDIDGTIIPYGKAIPESTINTIKELQKRGNTIFLATGRRYCEINNLMNELDIRNAICAAGGTIVINNKIVYEEFLPKTVLKDLLFDCRKTNTILVSLSNRQCYTSYKGKRLHPYLFLLNLISKFPFFRVGSVNSNIISPYLNITYLDDEDFLNMPTQKVLFYNRSILKKINCAPNCILYNSIIFWVMELNFKEKGIKYIQNKFNLNDSSIVVFGDGKNDIGMFKQYTNSIAMGNSCKILKSLASFITKNCDDDGIEYACKYFNWI